MNKTEKKKNLNWKKSAGITLAVAIFCGVLAFAIALNVSQQVDNTAPVSTKEIEFKSPMNNAVVVKDYADDHLQYNESLNRWEIHLAVDLASENGDVCACSDGVVSSVDMNSLDGYMLKIEHADGFVSVYSSLDEINNLKVGDKVKMGQHIAKADVSAAVENKEGSHLHFTLLKNGVEVDPNNYLDLQNK